jgi:hypothetical protein
MPSSANAVKVNGSSELPGAVMNVPSGVTPTSPPWV